MARADLIGQLLDDRYRVTERIGEGAMGSVYRAERIRLGRAVAIKVLHENVPDEATRRRFEREALAMAKLEHPHCGAVIDVGVHDGYPYVVMEFVSGQNLKELLTAGPVPIPRAVEITRQVLSGLTHAHEHGLIHRDIKPANIVMSQKAGVGDHAKILDFGIARSVHDTTNLTGSLVLGTPNYMAPEQIRGGAIDHRVDLYACGVMLFELLTGAKPFEAADPMAVCMLHLNAAAPTLASKCADRDFGPLEAVVARSLAKDPGQRFESAAQFSQALVAASQRIESRPVPDGTVPLSPVAAELPAPKSNRRVIAFGGIAVAIAALVVGITVTSRSDARSDATTDADPTSAPSAATRPKMAVSDIASAKPVESSPPAPPPAPPTPAQLDALAPDPVTDLVTRADQAAASGRREGAISMLQRARTTYPKDARIPYEVAKLYLDKLFVPDGLKNARAALALDPAYKTDPELIKLALKCFNAPATTDWTLASFLHNDIGPAAKPFLEETAASHPNPIVRARAAAELKRYK